MLRAPPDQVTTVADRRSLLGATSNWPDTGPPIRRFEGLRVLVVEDEYLVALLLEEDLRSAGCTIVGPHISLEAAVAAARDEAIGLAVLDVNLNGEMVYPLAEQLVARGVPLVFLTGYGIGHFPERLRTVSRVAKPHDRTALLREIGRALDEKTSSR